MIVRCVVDLPANWINPSDLEAAMQRSRQPHGNDVFEVEFRFSVGSNLMIDAAIRLLSLANQLALTSGRARLSFAEDEVGTIGYLNRAGFFDNLAATARSGPVIVRRTAATDASRTYSYLPLML